MKTTNLECAIIRAVSDRPGMIASEVRKHPYVAPHVGKSGVQKILYRMDQERTLYHHVRGGGNAGNREFYVLPKGWECIDCGKSRENGRKPSREDSERCRFCARGMTSPKYVGDQPNEMMDHWSRIPLVTETPYIPPVRFAVVAGCVE